MCCGCPTRIVQIGAGASFTFNVTAGIVPVTAGDFKWVKLHGVWGSGVSSTWLSSGDL